MRELAKWAQRRARAKRAVRNKRTSERSERSSEWTSEWPSTLVWVFGYSGPLWTSTWQQGWELLWAIVAWALRRLPLLPHPPLRSWGSQRPPTQFPPSDSLPLRQTKTRDVRDAPTTGNPFRYRVVKKKVSFGISSTIKTTYIIDFFTMKITVKVLSLSKF